MFKKIPAVFLTFLEKTLRLENYLKIITGVILEKKFEMFGMTGMQLTHNIYLASRV